MKRDSFAGRISVISFGLAGLLLSSPFMEQFGVTDFGVAHAAPNKEKKKKNTAKIKNKVKASGLAVLPEGSQVLKSARKSKVRSSALRSLVSSGTPPALVDIPGRTIKDLFWNEGVIDGILSGSPSPEQCNGFYAGNQDGDSGGFGACHMAESVGHTFQSILEAGTSLCYMKHFPVQANVDAGGVTLVSGEFPDNDVSKIFAPPAGAPRVIHAQISGFEGGGEGQGDEGGSSQEDIFIKIHPSTGSTLYRAELWFCTEGAVTGSDTIEISTSGRFVATNRNASNGGRSEDFESQVGAFLDVNGSALTFDATRSRSASVVSIGENGNFKAELELKPTNEIHVKQYDIFGEFPRKAHVVTKFSGTGPDSIRFLEGAFRELHSGSESFAGGTEFRGDRYVAAPDTALGQRVMSSEEMEADEFFGTEPTVEIDLSEYSCDTTPDIVVALDMSNPTVLGSVSECAERPFDGMHFCHDDEEVSQADHSYFSVCAVGGEPQ